jgi:phage terminase Nu1 subunit (DNA packaging protein)
LVAQGQATQAAFGAAVGISQQAVSELVRGGVLSDGATAAEWLLAYCHRLREQAAGRMGADTYGLDLVQERAALARAQREGIEIKNAALRGDFASVQLLAQVLANASQAVAERFDHLKADMRKACPDLPPEAADLVVTTIAEARNTWVAETAELVAQKLQPEDDPEADDEPLPD